MESTKNSLTPEPAVYRAAILLSAFGDSPYLGEQVHSIVQQMDVRDILIIVDDGSRKVRWTTIETWPRNFLVWSRLQQLGACGSFLSLIIHSTVKAEHYFLSDQDDLWMPGKINDQLLAHLNYGAGIQASTHKWACIRSQNRNSQALRAGRAIEPLACLSLAHYCFETPAPGMTLGFNANCRELLKTQQESLLALTDQLPHDRILFAIISLHGRIQVLDKVLVHYRQHTGNLVGALPPSIWQLWRQRLAWPRRAWRTATCGLTLYQQLNHTLEPSDPRRNGSTSTMQLRSDPWDNRLLQLILSFRAFLLRLIGGH